MTFSLPVSKYLAFILLFIINAHKLEAQVLNDTSTLKLVKETVEQIYSMRFSNASETAGKISKKFPQHPVVSLLKGMIIYWENFPLISGSVKGKEFEEQMRTCIERCEEFEPENEAEFLLANLCARGSLMAFYAGNNLSSKVFTLGSSTYRYLRRSFEFRDSFPDFLFFTGLYNYYREAYAEAHPVYKPLMAIFPRGDREKGMYELRKAFRESIFLKAEASTFLSSNYKYFENDFANASYYSSLIFRNYSANIVYRINCIEDFLLVQKYDEAEKLIRSPASQTDNSYFKAQFKILSGILAEKMYGDHDRAGEEYLKGIEILSDFKDYGNQYAAYAYFGLSRISSKKDDTQSQRIYRRKAMELTDFRNVTFD